MQHTKTCNTLLSSHLIIRPCLLPTFQYVHKCARFPQVACCRGSPQVPHAHVPPCQHIQVPATTQSAAVTAFVSITRCSRPPIHHPSPLTSPPFSSCWRPTRSKTSRAHCRVLVQLKCTHFVNPIIKVRCSQTQRRNAIKLLIHAIKGNVLPPSWKPSQPPKSYLPHVSETRAAPLQLTASPSTEL